jgi:hypothetical protein
VSVDDDRLHAEVGRQLGEIRAAVDGLMTRAGLLFTATGIGAAVAAASIDHVKSGRIDAALIALFVAMLLGVATLIPRLKLGPTPTALQGWMSGGSTAHTSGLLYDAKVALLAANSTLLAVMRTMFAFQALATLVAVGLALFYSAGK